jgi:hypothetical protein
LLDSKTDITEAVSFRKEGARIATGKEAGIVTLLINKFFRKDVSIFLT